MGYQLKLKEKIGYGLGDAASSMFWKLFSMYLLFFYTDIFGIPAAAAGTMFLLTRIWDAVNDPIMGIIADRTNSKWGKFRPYLIWMALPFGIIGVLLFSTPNLSINGKIIYAYVTYTLMMMAYTSINVPYAALMGVMTPDSKQRTSLASFRMVFAFAGSILVLATFQPLFDSFGSKYIASLSLQENKTARLNLSGNTSGLAYSGEINEIENINDSLLVLSMKVKSYSETPLNIGLYKSPGKDTVWINLNVDEAIKAGIKYNGTWNTVKIKLHNYVKRGLKLLKTGQLHIIVSVKNMDSFEIDNIEINEVNYQTGTRKAVVVIAIVAIIFFILTFLWTKERVKPVRNQQSSVKNDFKDLIKNGPWFILLGAGVSTLIFNSIRDGAAIYYFRYFVQNERAMELSFWGKSLPIAYSTLYLVLGQAANIIGVIMAKPISDKIGKRNTFLLSMILAAVFSILFYTFDKNALTLIFIFQFMISICAGSIFPILWSMYADIADYSEWKTGRRATGLIFSSSSMSQKFGWTLGGAITGWLLGYYGFKADVVQSAETQNAIRLMLSIFPAIGAAISIFFVYIYKLSDSFMRKINVELNQKRNSLKHNN